MCHCSIVSINPIPALCVPCVVGCHPVHEEESWEEAGKVGDDGAESISPEEDGVSEDPCLWENIAV